MARYLALFFVINLTALARAQVTQQRILLHPGWNAVWLEVAPTNSDPAVAFAGLPVGSIWTPGADSNSGQFIQNQTEAILHKAEWWGWIAPNRPESAFNNLHALFANTAYLIRFDGTSDAYVTVTGRPALRAPKWIPDGYTLRGLPVSPTTPPTFQDFFNLSSHHIDPTTGQIQPVYRLATNGTWSQVLPSDSTRNGEAYWVYTQGASSYFGPLSPSFTAGDGLVFGLKANTLSLQIQNLNAAPTAFSLVDEAAPSPTLLSLASLNTNGATQWLPLTGHFVQTVQPNDFQTLRLAIRRAEMTSADYGTVLELLDGAGDRWLIPVSASVPPGPLPGLASTPLDEAKSHSGLWWGTITINAVQEAHSGTLVTNGFVLGTDANGQPTAQPRSISRINISTNLTASGGEYNLRVLLHIDTNGVARLLKEVIQMWQPGPTTNNASGFASSAGPGHYVLLTDDSLIPNFSGTAIRNNTTVGRRLSTASFDFPPENGNNYLTLNGLFATGQSVAGVIDLSPDFNTNPFRHKYHPDHDNLNVTFDGRSVEAYEVTRAIQFDLLPAPANSRPGYGFDELSGNYHETLVGLHRSAITVGGSFRLNRVSSTAVLNQ